MTPRTSQWRGINVGIIQVTTVYLDVDLVVRTTPPLQRNENFEDISKVPNTTNLGITLLKKNCNNTNDYLYNFNLLFIVFDNTAFRVPSLS